MATTKINIVNRALGLLGAEFITSLTEDTKAARFSNELFDDTRDSIFRLHPWNSCIKRASLSLLTTTAILGLFLTTTVLVFTFN